MKRIVPILILVSMSLGLAACAGKPAVRVSLTPEQKFALAKISAQAVSSGLAIRIADLERNKEANADKIRILTAVKGFLDEFNAQVADVTSLDLSGREQVRTAIKKALAAADHLTANDVLQLNDPTVQAEIKAAIEVARSAVQSFDAFFPNVQPTQSQ